MFTRLKQTANTVPTLTTRVLAHLRHQYTHDELSVEEYEQQVQHADAQKFCCYSCAADITAQVRSEVEAQPFGKVKRRPLQASTWGVRCQCGQLNMIDFLV